MPFVLILKPHATRHLYMLCPLFPPSSLVPRSFVSRTLPAIEDRHHRCSWVTSRRRLKAVTSAICSRTLAPSTMRGSHASPLALALCGSKMNVMRYCLTAQQPLHDALRRFCTAFCRSMRDIAGKRIGNTAPFPTWLQIYRDIPSSLSPSILLYLKISSMRARTLTGASVLAAASG